MMTTARMTSRTCSTHARASDLGRVVVSDCPSPAWRVTWPSTGALSSAARRCKLPKAPLHHAARGQGSPAIEAAALVVARPAPRRRRWVANQCAPGPSSPRQRMPLLDAASLPLFWMPRASLPLLCLFASSCRSACPDQNQWRSLGASSCLARQPHVPRASMHLQQWPALLPLSCQPLATSCGGVSATALSQPSMAQDPWRSVGLGLMGVRLRPAASTRDPKRRRSPIPYKWITWSSQQGLFLVQRRGSFAGCAPTLKAAVGNQVLLRTRLAERSRLFRCMLHALYDLH